MTEADFWTLVAVTKRSDPTEHAERLAARVAGLPVPDILSFGRCWEDAKVAAYDWNLWGAAYLMNGGCSDDGFTDFRSWLILKGEKAYRDALANPDSLAKARVEPDEAACECYPAATAYGRAVAETDAVNYHDALIAALGPLPQRADPTGEQWDFDNDDEMKTRLPRLYKKFSDA